MCVCEGGGGRGGGAGVNTARRQGQPRVDRRGCGHSVVSHWSEVERMASVNVATCQCVLVVFFIERLA